jgi:quinol-cytochrome oxidoreductase complex cytochrome b subunit
MADQNPNKKSKQLLPFWPHYILSEFIAWYAMLGVLIALASLFPADLQAKADPFRTPPDVKPEWYFLFLYQLLKDVAFLNVINPELPKLAGITFPAIGLALLALLPFLDRSKKRPAHQRPLMLAIVVIILLVIVFLTVRGQLIGESTTWLILSQWRV